MSITSVTGNTPNLCTTSFDFTLNIFMKQVSITYWRDRKSDLLVGHTSIAQYSMGRHLVLTTWTTTSGDTTHLTFPKNCITQWSQINKQSHTGKTTQTAWKTRRKNQEDRLTSEIPTAAKEKKDWLTDWLTDWDVMAVSARIGYIPEYQKVRCG